MKVLHVIDALGVGGGAEHALAGMLPLLRERGIESSVACLIPRKGGLQEVVREQGFPVEVLAGRSLTSRVRALRRKVQSETPDLVHATLFNACLATRFACVGLDVARLDSLVNTSYDPVRTVQLRIPPWKLRGVRMLDAATARHLGGSFHAITETVRDEAIEVLGIPADRITVIPRGRSALALGERTPERRQAARGRLGLVTDVPVLLNVGRQDSQKAQVELVRAFARVRNQAPGAVLLIAGREGDASQRVRAAIAEHGLMDAVRLLGHRDDVADLYVASDLFVFPSHYEGLGSAIIEAMALGAPVIGSDAPAIREVLGDGRYGVIVPRGDVEALSRAVVATLNDEDRREALRRSARTRFEQVYELGSVVAATVGLYDKIARVATRG
jgi:glycosyltransferase involved in cell wall biosynthesis